jgi:ribosomal protein L37AE/L43A
MNYGEFLIQLYNRSWAAQRKQLRKDKQPCIICGEHNVEVTTEGFWLCREHRIELQNIQPKWTVLQKLDRIGVEPPTEEDYLAGKIYVKKCKPKKIRFILDYKTSIFTYGSGSIQVKDIKY